MGKKSLYLIIILIGLNLITLTYFNNKVSKLNTDNYNLTVKSDSIIKTYNKKTKEIEFSKKSYQVEKLKDLKQYDQKFYNSISDQSKTIAAITTTTSVAIKQQNQTNAIIDSISKFRFTYSDKSINQLITGTNKIKGNSMIISIDTNSIKLNLKYSIIEEKNKYLIKAYTSSHAVTVDDLSSVVITKSNKKNHWSIGLFLGYGINTDNQLNNARCGWSAGFGINYKIW